jgi:NAD(P)-dependent dehydrogenase (short-subunit alcohol dehydrogenase family)
MLILFRLQLRVSRLIMAVRSLPKGEAAAASLRAEFPDAKIVVWELDMASFGSVQAFAARCDRELDRLHVAVLNAGLAKLDYERAEEGGHREMTIQVNYLATALLAILVIPKLKPVPSSSRPGRLSIITSDAALGVKLKDPGQGTLLEWFDQPEKFDGFQQYSRSKLLITMFVARLAEAVSPYEVIINSCNPGPVKGTAFISEMDSWVIRVAFGLVQSLLGRKAVDGAAVYIHSCLVLGKESHGSWTDWAIRA